MEDIGPILGAFAFLALIVGGVLFLPVASLRRHRRVAKWLTIGGGIVFVVAMILTPTDPKKKAGAQSASGNTAPSPSPSASPDEAAAQRATFLKNYRETLEIAGSCDRAIASVGKAAQGGSEVALYSAAKDGQAACQSAWQALENMETTTGEKEEKAIKTCRGTYFLRQRAMETAMTIADGDSKPSNVVSFQDDMKTGQAGVMLCVAQWMEAGAAIGVKPEAMK